MSSSNPETDVSMIELSPVSQSRQPLVDEEDVTSRFSDEQRPPKHTRFETPDLEDGAGDATVIKKKGYYRMVSPRKSYQLHSYENPDKQSPVGLMMNWSKSAESSVREWYKKTFRLPACLLPFYDITDLYFECTCRGSSVETEIFAGVINFFSCSFILAVVPHQLHKAHYNSEVVASAMSIIMGTGSILLGLFANIPLVVAPLAAVTVYFANSLRGYNLSPHSGDLIVMYMGIFLVGLGAFPPASRLLSKFIPPYIQLGTTVGIGLITALSGYQEVEIVVRGKYTLLSVGKITPEICIAMSGLIGTAVGVYYHSKYAYFLCLVWGTFLWWASQDAWPSSIGADPEFEGTIFSSFSDNNGTLITLQMCFLMLLTLFGLAKALCELAGIMANDNETIPRGRIVLIVIGLCNIFSGCIYGPPFVLSPESASGIKSGARTGLSSIVAGFGLLLTMFLAPLFTAIPEAATAPILIMIGGVLFQNVKNINFSKKYGIAAFVCLTLIPFTNSIIAGIGFAYVTYVIISFLNGDVWKNVKKIYYFYCLPMKEDDDGMEEGDDMADGGEGDDIDVEGGEYLGKEEPYEGIGEAEEGMRGDEDEEGEGGAVGGDDNGPGLEMGNIYPAGRGSMETVEMEMREAYSDPVTGQQRPSFTMREAFSKNHPRTSHLSQTTDQRPSYTAVGGGSRPSLTASSNTRGRSATEAGGAAAAAGGGGRDRGPSFGGTVRRRVNTIWDELGVGNDFVHIDVSRM
jgi:AGZA family xanthine/uracil permease-like MFS transporter